MSAHPNRPGWLEDKITANQRKAKQSTCRTCGAPVLAGLDEDVLATMAVVDPTQVTYLEAIHAHLNGRDVYSMWGGDLCHMDAMCLGKAAQSMRLFVKHVCQPGANNTPGPVENGGLW